MTNEAPELIVLTTEGCHLCEVAAQVIASAVNLEQVYVEMVDIAEEPDASQLIDQYGTRLPVVKHIASKKELDWPFDSATFARWFDLANG